MDGTRRAVSMLGLAVAFVLSLTSTFVLAGAIAVSTRFVPYRREACVEFETLDTEYPPDAVKVIEP